MVEKQQLIEKIEQLKAQTHRTTGKINDVVSYAVYAKPNFYVAELDKILVYLDEKTVDILKLDLASYLLLGRKRDANHSYDLMYEMQYEAKANALAVLALLEIKERKT